MTDGTGAETIIALVSEGLSTIGSAVCMLELLGIVGFKVEIDFTS